MAQMADGSGLAVSPAVAAACGSHSPLLSTRQVGAAIREGSSSSAHTDLSVNEVYAMTTHLGQELQKLASEYGTVGMEGLVELVAQTLEKLEHYVVENERLNTENCRILLELDQLVLAKESEEILQTELQVRTTTVHHLQYSFFYAPPPLYCVCVCVCVCVKIYCG